VLRVSPEEHPSLDFGRKTSMFGLLTRASSKAPVASCLVPRRARLRLEELEGRALPSTVTLAVTYGTGKNITLSGVLSNTATVSGQQIDISGVASGTATTDASGDFSVNLTATGLGDVKAVTHDQSSNAATVTLTDQAPVLTAFQATEGTNHVWTLSGTVTYFRYFASMTINFGGTPVHVQGVTTNADETGHFEVCVQLDGQADDNGLVWAQAVSPWGTTSDKLYDTILQTGGGPDGHNGGLNS
jgi:hypothetical protein